MTFPSSSNNKGNSNSTNRANYDAEYAVSPEYLPTAAVATDEDNNGRNQDDLPVATAFPLAGEEEDLRYAPSHGAVHGPPTFANSLMPTATPTVGSASLGPMHHSSMTTPEQFQPNTASGYSSSDAAAATSSPTPHVTTITTTHQYPAPPPPASAGRRHRRTGCIICGSLAATAAIVFCLCCILPLIIVLGAFRQSQQTAENPVSSWDDDLMYMNDNMTQTMHDDGFLYYNGTR
ncbi:hypothetical protein MPSEU_000030900 [Mayamaea pseudoterrestris]|nr:hypothetical protein MPSEU_000030900 [Mayamaea pseudoterrestris]